MLSPSDSAGDPDAAIDRYLAGELSPDEARAFEHAASRDAVLVSLFIHAQAAHEALGRTVPVPPASQAAEQLAIAQQALLAAPLDPAAPALPSPKPWNHTPIVLGSTLALTAAAAITWLATLGPATPPRFADPAALIAAVRFEPTTSATQPDGLEEILSAKLGRRITLPRSPTVRYLGLRTDAGVSPVGVVLLATDGDRRLVLTLDLAGPAHTPPPPPTGIATPTRRERTAAGVHITEWTTGDHAAILDAISVQ